MCPLYEWNKGWNELTWRDTILALALWSCRARMAVDKRLRDKYELFFLPEIRTGSTIALVGMRNT